MTTAENYVNWPIKIITVGSCVLHAFNHAMKADQIFYKYIHLPLNVSALIFVHPFLVDCYLFLMRAAGVLIL